MISRYQMLDKELIRHRNEVRGVYSTPSGKLELARVLKQSGVFDEITCTPEAVERRNLGIRKMDEMGLLDEENIAYLIDWLLDQPLAFRRLADE